MVKAAAVVVVHRPIIREAAGGINRTRTTGPVTVITIGATILIDAIRTKIATATPMIIQAARATIHVRHMIVIRHATGIYNNIKNVLIKNQITTTRIRVRCLSSTPRSI